MAIVLSFLSRIMFSKVSTLSFMHTCINKSDEVQVQPGIIFLHKSCTGLLLSCHGFFRSQFSYLMQVVSLFLPHALHQSLKYHYELIKEESTWICKLLFKLSLSCYTLGLRGMDDENNRPSAAQQTSQLAKNVQFFFQ